MNGFGLEEIRHRLSRAGKSVNLHVREMANALRNIRPIEIRVGVPKSRLLPDAGFSWEKVECLLEEILHEVREKKKGHIYLVGSWLLRDCYEYLCRKPTEMMHFVTGVRFSNIFILERMVKFDFERASPVYISGDVSSSFGSLLEIERYGYSVNAWFHSHPGNGESQAFASSIDIRNQERLERGGYPAIGGVFSQDGYIRFFSQNRKFDVIVLGKGVEKIGDNLYGLSRTNDMRESCGTHKQGDLFHERDKSDCIGRGWGDA
jgi:proteasome lid subunit RPN8/RPN11